MSQLCTVLCIFSCVSITLCSSRCDQLFEHGVSEFDKRIIVDKHNHFRASASQNIGRGGPRGHPRGRNLNPLRWNDRLAREAQTLANTCEFQHTGIRDDRFVAGQNFGWSASSNRSPGTDWAGIIQQWFNEHRDFVYPKGPEGLVGHHTRVTPDDTCLIGCGFSSFRTHSRYQKLYVCNYGSS